jgi:hypothetical protein
LQKIIEVGGIASENDYPYLADTEKMCRANMSKLPVYINSSLALPNNEKLIAAYLYKHGPLSARKLLNWNIS